MTKASSPSPHSLLPLQNRFRTKEGQEGAKFKELTKQLEQLQQQLEASQQKLTLDEQSLQQVKGCYHCVRPGVCKLVHDIRLN